MRSGQFAPPWIWWLRWPKWERRLALPGLAARAGVVTGEVAVTLGAVGEGMVAGDAVNTAARVQATAEPGQVLVDAATQRLAGMAIGFVDAGEHALKGKGEPARLWRATRVVAGVGGSQRVDGLEAPLTGRDAELRHGQGAIPCSSRAAGDRGWCWSPARPGVGKSRLGWEFEKYADGLAAAGVVAPGPVPVLRRRGGVLGAGGDRPAAAGHRRGREPRRGCGGQLAEGLDRFVSDPGERAYIGARLGRLLGVTVSAVMAAARCRGRSCSRRGGVLRAAGGGGARWCW